MSKNKEKKENGARLERTASFIVRTLQERLMILLPFLNRAVLRMPYLPTKTSYENPLPSTNGKGIYSAPEVIISMYRRHGAKLTRIYLHMILHCLFCHPFRYEMLDAELWDVCSDISVENVVLELGKKELALKGDNKRLEFISRMKELVSPLTADRLYRYFRLNEDEKQKALSVCELFRQDSHWMWIASEDMFGGEIESDEGENQFAAGEVEQQWKSTSDIIRTETEFLSKLREDVPGSAVQNIRELSRDRVDYREFLTRFIAPREEIRINNDEFDYIYYTYGLRLYGNIPLIEPLEYRDDNRIHDLIIAIDTSGSCQGRIVRSFLAKTCSIIRESGMFFSQFRLHIIQCDSAIQSDETITNQLEFESYLSHLKVKGFGGTDFRPVFDLADKYLRGKEFHDLKGLIYFTDGLGIYPPYAPEYPAAFVIIEDPKEKPQVPAWAIKQITTIDELERSGRINLKRFRERA